MTRHRPATPAYSSPEQLQGQAITTTSDCTRWERSPTCHDRTRPYALARLHRRDGAGGHDRGPAASQPDSWAGARHARKLRGDLETVLVKAVAKEPGRRYASVEQLADDLEAYRSGHPVRGVPTRWPIGWEGGEPSSGRIRGRRRPRRGLVRSPS